jgi:dTDP-4-dehydrorhamnose reductase
METNLKKGNQIGLYVDQFRTPVYVENIADALLELAENMFCGTIHLGGANRINRYDFGLELCAVCRYDKDLLVKSSMSDSTPTAPRPRDVSLSIEKAKMVLKTRLLSTREGLEEMIKKR